MESTTNPTNLERMLVSIDFDLRHLMKEMEEIKSEWDGNDSGILEDRANIAKEIEEKSKELISLMAELDESF